LEASLIWAEHISRTYSFWIPRLIRQFVNVTNSNRDSRDKARRFSVIIERSKNPSSIDISDIRYEPPRAAIDVGSLSNFHMLSADLSGPRRHPCTNTEKARNRHKQARYPYESNRPIGEAPLARRLIEAFLLIPLSLGCSVLGWEYCYRERCAGIVLVAEVSELFC
jgi:hypothetical protein